MSSQSGYRPELEDRAFLAALPKQELLLGDGYEEVRLDPRKLVKVENQGQQGACAGHSLSSIMEWCYCIATGGEMKQLSRAMAYYEAQRLSNIRGDNGSTISAGVKLALNTGVCDESLWKYPSSYNPARPASFDAVLENAAKNKLKSATPIKSYNDYRTFVGSGRGGVHNGISWGTGMSRAVVETFAPGGGGHAIAGLCLSEREDSQCRPYVWILNSWDLSFGSREVPGWQEWSPRAIEQMLSHQWTEMVGLSDMEVPKPRKFSLEEWKQKIRV